MADNITGRLNENIRRFKKVSYVERTDTYEAGENRNIFDPCEQRGPIIDCSLGINPLGFSDKIDPGGFQLKRENLCRYPDPAYTELIREIRAYWRDLGVNFSGQVFVGTGAAGILKNLVNMFIDSAGRALGYTPQFSEVINFVRLAGGEYHSLKLTGREDFRFSGRKFLQKMDENFDLVYLDNPNNPTGQVIDLAEIKRVIERAGSLAIPVVVDEAFAEFMPEKNSALNLLSEYNNLIVVRSFSKGLGLPDIRLGYVFMPPDLAPYYEKINLPPFVFSRSLQGLAAAALKDRSFIRKSRRVISREKEELLECCPDEFQLYPGAPTVPLFMMALGEHDVDLHRLLLSAGIKTAPGGGFPGLKNNIVRLCLPGQKREDLKERFKNLDSIIDNI